MEQQEELKSSDEPQQSQKFKYMIFVWNGKQAGPFSKTAALTKGYDLDDLLAKAKDKVL